MDPSEQRDASINVLIELHAAKCRLAVMVDAKKRRGEPTDDLERQLAANRVEANAFAALLRANRGACTL